MRGKQFAIGFLSLVLAAVFTADTAEAQGDIHMTPEMPTVPVFDPGMISLELVSGNTSTNLFVFDVTADGYPETGTLSSAVFAEFDANILSVSDQNPVYPDGFFGLSTIVQVANRVDVQVVIRNQSSATGRLTIQFADTPRQVRFFNQQEPLTSVTATFAVLVGFEILPNCVKNDGHGVVAAAIFGSATFDVLEIDDTSLVLDGFEVRMRGNRGPSCNVTNPNGDEFDDLLCLFEDGAPDNWIPGEGDATLHGALLDGTPIVGMASICVLP